MKHFCTMIFNWMYLNLTLIVDEISSSGNFILILSYCNNTILSSRILFLTYNSIIYLIITKHLISLV